MLSEADIVTVIMGFAAQCGDPKPTAIRYARGSRGELDRAIGG